MLPGRGLEINTNWCMSSVVARRLKTFIAILMAVLAVGIPMPQSAFATATRDAGNTCCGSEGSTCKCPPAAPCSSSCSHVLVQISDKQLPARTTLHGGSLLFLLASIKIEYPAFVPVVVERNVNVSPPFGGSPPQAVLRLWLI